LVSIQLGRFLYHSCDFVNTLIKPANMIYLEVFNVN